MGSRLFLFGIFYLAYGKYDQLINTSLCSFTSSYSSVKLPTVCALHFYNCLIRSLLNPHAHIASAVYQKNAQSQQSNRTPSIEIQLTGNHERDTISDANLHTLANQHPKTKMDRERGESPTSRRGGETGGLTGECFFRRQQRVSLGGFRWSCDWLSSLYILFHALC